MKEYKNKQGTVIKLKDTFSYKHARFTIERIYRNKQGVVKVLTTNGVIFDAENMKMVENKHDTEDTR